MPYSTPSGRGRTADYDNNNRNRSRSCSRRPTSNSDRSRSRPRQLQVPSPIRKEAEGLCEEQHCRSKSDLFLVKEMAVCLDCFGDQAFEREAYICLGCAIARHNGHSTKLCADFFVENKKDALLEKIAKDEARIRRHLAEFSEQKEKTNQLLTSLLDAALQHSRLLEEQKARVQSATHENDALAASKQSERLVRQVADFVKHFSETIAKTFSQQLKELLEEVGANICGEVEEGANIRGEVEEGEVDENESLRANGARYQIQQIRGRNGDNEFVGASSSNASCINGHGKQNITPLFPLKRVPCKFYYRGTCKYGENCKFLHSDAINCNTSVPVKRFRGPRTPPGSPPSSQIGEFGN